MMRVLLVDDDSVTLKLYQDGLGRRGFQVDTAPDGLAAVQMLHSLRPDVIVLDLMMPKLSGVDVLKFIRGQAELAPLPVIVLSNVYLSELAEQAVAIGVQKALLKTRCSPAVLTEVIHELVAGKGMPPTSIKDMTSPPPSTPMQPVEKASAGSITIVESLQPVQKPTATETFTKPRINFLEHAPTTCAGIRTLCKAFVNAPDQTSRAARLEEFYRKVRFLTATSGFAHFQAIALLGSAFEAMLFELREKPDSLTPSVIRTMVSTVDFVSDLCQRAREEANEFEFSAHVLVVDDDPLANRLVVAALLRAHLPAQSTEDPITALKLLREKRFDLLLLDIEMPGMDGFELCKRVRALPGYLKTPVIYVTAHTDFEHRTKSVLSGGNDLIGKPVFPMELAVKSVTHLLKGHHDASTARL